MRTELYWIEGPWPGRLAILARPRGGDWLGDEVIAWKHTGLYVVASVLTPDEVLELDLLQEAPLCEAQGIQFLCFPIQDRSIPASRQAALDFVRHLDEHLARGQSIAIHCRQGVGRSALVAACLLVLCGISPEEAFQRVSAARGCRVPETPQQREWVVELARGLAAQHA
jgi:protein-tyrosine phosphatase